MIKYEWRASLSPAESAQVSDLLRRAAEYDAEPDYNTIDFNDVEIAMSQADSASRHLLIWMLPHATAMNEPEVPERIAGLLRLVRTSDDAAEATLVIDPHLRSIGIATLLAEQLGLHNAATTLPDSWIDDGASTITAWARGNHPAAERLSNRFLIARTRRIWKLIRSTASEDSTAAAVLEPLNGSARADCGWASGIVGAQPLHALREAGRVVGVVALDLRAVHSEEFGRCATIETAIGAPNADLNSHRRLLEGAAAVAHGAGLTGVIIYVDPDEADLVNACRLTGFQHDRTDVCYQLGSHR